VRDAPPNVAGPRKAYATPLVRRDDERKKGEWNVRPLPERKRWPIETVSRERLSRTPKSVQSCFNFCGQHRLGFYTWPVEGPVTSVTRGCYFCTSWRCEGDCQRRAASIMFARIKEAVERPHYRADGWVYFVLTIDRHGTLSGDAWKNEETAYRELGKMTGRFLEALRRDQKRHGERVLKNEWAQVIEAHRSGWPHANLMVYAPELAEKLERERVALAAAGASEREARLVQGRMRVLVVNAGWGTISTAEQVRSRDALAGYLVKLAGYFDKAVAEVAKLTQVPLNAPPRFRRLRSGKGFLPPKHKSDKLTGTMVVRVAASQHGPHVVPVQQLRPELHELASACCELEERLWVDERLGGPSRQRLSTHKLERARVQVPFKNGKAASGTAAASPDVAVSGSPSPSVGSSTPAGEVAPVGAVVPSVRGPSDASAAQVREGSARIGVESSGDTFSGDAQGELPF
jgi:hypothetical protein